MGFILFFGVGIGYFAAVVSTVFIGRRLVAAMMPKQPVGLADRRTIIRGALAGAVIAFVPSLLLGIVIGGTLGGTYGSALAANARDSGALAGVALGVFAVATILLSASVAAGAWLGRLWGGRDEAP